MTWAMATHAHAATNHATTQLVKQSHAHSTTTKNAAVTCHNTTNKHVAVMFHNTIVKHAAVKFHSITQLVNVYSAKRKFTINTANTFHNTATSAAHSLAALHHAIHANSNG